MIAAGSNQEIVQVRSEDEDRWLVSRSADLEQRQLYNYYIVVQDERNPMNYHDHQQAASFQKMVNKKKIF